MASIFEQIIAKKIPATFYHEDEHCIAIKDIDSKAPTHFLVIPKKPIRSLNEATTEDQMLLGHLLLVTQKVAKDLGIAESGYRVVNNINQDGGQSVFHLHIHVLGGRSLTWPPG